MDASDGNPHPASEAFKKLQIAVSKLYVDGLQIIGAMGPIDGVVSPATFYCKRNYPWMDPELFIREPTLLEEINANYPSGNSAVIALNALSYHNGDLEACMKEPIPQNMLSDSNDVGPLGIVAVRDIPKGGIVLVDHTHAKVNNVLPSYGRHCDACMASFAGKYQRQISLKIPECKCKIAFCSNACLIAATQGYHKALCGKNFTWLYKMVKEGPEVDESWRSLIFLRIVAIVLSDMGYENQPSNNASTRPLQQRSGHPNNAQGSDSIHISRQVQRKSFVPKLKSIPENKHPLLHPLLARLCSGSSKSNISWPWELNAFVVRPYQILSMFGIDVYNDKNWTPEVVHTIMHRIYNNESANMGVSSLRINGVFQEQLWGIVGINPNYVFFNHSCHPNVEWSAAGAQEQTVECSKKGVGAHKIDEKEQFAVDSLPAGSNATICRAMRDIKKGEECYIDYLPGMETGRFESLAAYDIRCDCQLCLAYQG